MCWVKIPPGCPRSRCVHPPDGIGISFQCIDTQPGQKKVNVCFDDKAYMEGGSLLIQIQKGFNKHLNILIYATKLKPG